MPKHNENLNRQNVTVFYTFPRANISFNDNPFQLSLCNINNRNKPIISLTLYKYLIQLKQKVLDNAILIDCNLFTYLFVPIYFLKHFYTVPVILTDITFNNKKDFQETPLNIHFFEFIEMFNVLHLSNDAVFKQKAITPPHIRDHINFLYIGDPENTVQYYQANMFLRKRFNNKDQYHFYTNQTKPIDILQKVTCANIEMEYITIDAFNEHQDEYSIVRQTLLYFIIALNVQRYCGNLILKLSDCFTELSIDVVYLISSFYEKTFFIKPTVTSLSSSSRYIICKGFYGTNNHTLAYLNSLFIQICKMNDTMQLKRILKVNIPVMFINKIEEINSILNQSRLEFIHQKINYFEMDRDNAFRNKENNNHIKRPSMYEIKKCTDWCNRFHIPINTII